MALLKQIMLDAIEKSAEQAKNLINGFDWDKTKDELAEKGDQFVGFGKSLVDDVKNSLGRVMAQTENMPSFAITKKHATLTVPYSKEAGDKLKWKVTDNTLSISIERMSDSYESKRTYRQTIPEGCSEKPSFINANREAKTVSFMFDRDEGEDNEFEEVY